MAGYLTGAIEKIALDLKNFSSIEEIEKIIKKDISTRFKDNPEVSLGSLVGHYCFGSQLLINHSLNNIIKYGEIRKIKIIFFLDLAASNNTMLRYGETFRNSGFSAVVIPFTQGDAPVKAFMKGISSDPVAKIGKSLKERNRPIVLGLGIPEDSCLTQSTIRHGKNKLPYFEYILRTRIDGIACSAEDIAYYKLSTYTNKYKLATDTEFDTVEKAIEDGADFTLLREPSYPDYGKDEKAKNRLAFIREIESGMTKKPNIFKELKMVKPKIQDQKKASKKTTNA